MQNLDKPALNLGYVITYPCPNFNGGLVKSPLKIG